MASEDLEWLLHQFSSGDSALPKLKSLGPKQDVSVGTALPLKNFHRSSNFEEGIQESFRDILSRSPYIFAANKRQEALLVEAASLEKPVFSFTSSVPSHLPAGIAVFQPRREEPTRPFVNLSPKRVAAAAVVAPPPLPRNGRLSAPPILETTIAVCDAPGTTVERRGKQAVMERMERLRADDDALMLLRHKVERYALRDKGKSSGSLSPVLKNRKEVKEQTLANRMSRLEGQRLAREQAMERVRESLVNQRQVFMEKMAAKSRHEQWLELKRAQQRERALQLAKDALAHKWAVNSAVVNMLLSIRSLFQLCRQKLPLLKRVKYCVRVIIKTFRQYRLWKETKRIQAERNICSRICWRFLLNWRIRKKIWALAAIKEMLGILKSMGVLQRAVRSFKYRVILGQRCISSFLAVVKGRLRVQQLQWATMHLAWAKAVAERQAKLNKTKLPATISAVYQRLVGHYKSHHLRPPPNAVRRYNNFIKSSSLLPLVLDTNPEDVPCCTALLVVSQLKQLQKDTRKQYIVRQKRALAGNATIKEQETLLRIRMQARSLLCKVSVEEKMAHEESVLQLQRTYAKTPPFPSTMPKPSLIQVMADYISPSAVMATASASVTMKMEVAGD